MRRRYRPGPTCFRPIYLAELEKLQDQIPPFSNADAYAVIQLETGQAPSALFSELSSDTVAAASLGQVPSCRFEQARGAACRSAVLATPLWPRCPAWQRCTRAAGAGDVLLDGWQGGFGKAQGGATSSLC